VASNNLFEQLFCRGVFFLFLARRVDREAAQMIVEAAGAGVIGVEQATMSLRLLYEQTSKHHLFR